MSEAEKGGGDPCVRRFEMSGRYYRTDPATLRVLRQVVQSYRKGGSKDISAVAAVMHLGLKVGRIVQQQQVTK